MSWIGPSPLRCSPLWPLRELLSNRSYLLYVVLEYVVLGYALLGSVVTGSVVTGNAVGNVAVAGTGTGTGTGTHVFHGETTLYGGNGL